MFHSYGLAPDTPPGLFFGCKNCPIYSRLRQLADPKKTLKVRTGLLRQLRQWNIP